MPEPESQVADGEPINIAEVLSRFSDDREFLVDMLGEFLLQMQERIQQLHAAIEVLNGPELARLAHNVKGIASNFGAEPLTTYARETEVFAKEENYAAVQEWIVKIENEMPRLQDFYKRVH
jgi:two-component system, sensor histidine kinase and response regulator